MSGAHHTLIVLDSKGSKTTQNVIPTSVTQRIAMELEYHQCSGSGNGKSEPSEILAARENASGDAIAAHPGGADPEQSESINEESQFTEGVLLSSPEEGANSGLVSSPGNSVATTENSSPVQLATDEVRHPITQYGCLNAHHGS